MEKQNESQMEQKQGRTVVFFPLPLQGHTNPMLQLANILYSKGFSIAIIHTKLNSPNPSDHPHFTFHAIADGLSDSERSITDIVAHVSRLNAGCRAPFHDCLAKLMMSGSENSIACLVSDVAWDFTQDVADSFKLPRLLLRSNNACSFLAFASLPLMLEKGYLPMQEFQADVPVPELPPLRIKDLPMFETQYHKSVCQSVSTMIFQAKSSLGVIWNTFEDLEHAALTTIRQDYSSLSVFPIGPLHKYFPLPPSGLLSPDRSCLSWLDHQAPNSVLYVSIGSLATINETAFLEIASGLADSQQSFLWVVRPGSVRGSEWIEPLADGFLERLGGRGKIVKWAPQREVLAHSATGGFWTHCGWNSTLESLCEGVPMICQPCFGDQMVNARYVSDVWRTGLHLENKVERREMARAIRRIMVGAEGQEMRQRAVNLAKKADQSVRQGGSSYDSLERMISCLIYH